MKWISVKDEMPPPNTQCKCKTIEGKIDNVGNGWFDGEYWWEWDQDMKIKFRVKSGFITHYIPLFNREPITPE
jgi:hypothetical protein